MSERNAVHLSFPAKADYLLLARLALSGMARSLPVDVELLADLKLAVTEACGNAVRHAYGAEGEGAVGVTFLVEGRRLEMIVEDQGAGIDAGAVVLDGLEGRDAPLEGAMGMAIIGAIVDELDIAPGADGYGTVVRMTKYLPDAPQGAEARASATDL